MAFSKERLANGWTRNDPGMGRSWYTKTPAKNPRGHLLISSKTTTTKYWWKVEWFVKYAPRWKIGTPSWVVVGGPFKSLEAAFESAEGK